MSQFLVIVFGLYLLVVGFLKFYDYRRFSKGDSPALKLEQAHREIGILTNQLSEVTALSAKQFDLNLQLQEQFEKLRFAKISGDIKLGQKAEHLLPFLEGFKYKDDEIKGLFQPVDLIVFRQDEIVFVEIKTGTSPLTEKERRIRDNVKAGRVRFEVHRLNEKGVTVK